MVVLIEPHDHDLRPEDHYEACKRLSYVAELCKQEGDGKTDSERDSVVRHEPRVEGRGDADRDRDGGERPEGVTPTRKERRHDRDDQQNVEPGRAFRTARVMLVHDRDRDAETQADHDQTVEPVTRHQPPDGAHDCTVLRGGDLRLAHEDDCRLIRRDEAQSGDEAQTAAPSMFFVTTSIVCCNSFVGLNSTISVSAYKTGVWPGPT